MIAILMVDHTSMTTKIAPFWGAVQQCAMCLYQNKTRCFHVYFWVMSSREQYKGNRLVFFCCCCYFKSTKRWHRLLREVTFDVIVILFGGAAKVMYFFGGNNIDWSRLSNRLRLLKLHDFRWDITWLQSVANVAKPSIMCD